MSAYEKLMAKALSTTSESEAVEAFKMARKRYDGQAAPQAKQRPQYDVSRQDYDRVAAAAKQSTKLLNEMTQEMRTLQQTQYRTTEALIRARKERDAANGSATFWMIISAVNIVAMIFAAIIVFFT